MKNYIIAILIIACVTTCIFSCQFGKGKKDETATLPTIGLTFDKEEHAAKLDSLTTGANLRKAGSSKMTLIETAKRYARQKQDDSAIAVLENILKADSTYIEGHAAIGFILYNQKLKDESKIHFNKAIGLCEDILKKTPGSKYALMNRVFYLRYVDDAKVQQNRDAYVGELAANMDADEKKLLDNILSMDLDTFASSVF